MGTEICLRFFLTLQLPASSTSLILFSSFLNVPACYHLLDLLVFSLTSWNHKFFRANLWSPKSQMAGAPREAPSHSNWPGLWESSESNKIWETLFQFRDIRTDDFQSGTYMFKISLFVLQYYIKYYITYSIHVAHGFRAAKCGTLISQWKVKYCLICWKAVLIQHVTVHCQHWFFIFHHIPVKLQRLLFRKREHKHRAQRSLKIRQTFLHQLLTGKRPGGGNWTVLLCGNNIVQICQW